MRDYLVTPLKRTLLWGCKKLACFLRSYSRAESDCTTASNIRYFTLCSHFLTHYLLFFDSFDYISQSTQSSIDALPISLSRTIFFFSAPALHGAVAEAFGRAFTEPHAYGHIRGFLASNLSAIMPTRADCRKRSLCLRLISHFAL